MHLFKIVNLKRSLAALGAMSLLAVGLTTTGDVVHADSASASEWSACAQDLNDWQMSANQSFANGEFCLVANYYTHAIYQTDGNFVVYQNEIAIWNSGTFSRGAARIALQSDGNIVIYNGSGQAIWASMSFGSSHFLRMQVDGNLVLYKSPFYSNVAIWSSKYGRA